MPTPQALPRDKFGEPIQMTHQGPTTNLGFNATSARSGALGETTKGVRLSASDADCYYKVGDNAVIAANDGTGGSLLPVGAVEYRAVLPGQYIAVIVAPGAASGTLNIEEIV